MRRFVLFVALLFMVTPTLRAQDASPVAAEPAIVAPLRNLLAADVRAEIVKAAQARRVPTVLLLALAQVLSGGRQFDDATGQLIATCDARGVGVLRVPVKGRKDVDKLTNDWRYNIEQGARWLEICWNRAPIVGYETLDDGRNILEAWYHAIGRYGVGKEGPEAHAFADKVLDALRDGTNGLPAVAVSRPDAARLALSRNYIGLPAPWHFGDVSPRPADTKNVVNLPVPYFHQTADAPDGFDGGGACGPASMLMVLAWAGKVLPAPVVARDSYAHTSQYGGLLFDLYGKVCSPNLGAVHAWMLDYLRPFFPQVAIFYNEKATWTLVKAELDAGRPVMLGTQVTPAGHLMVARGYTDDGRVRVNDPAGDQTRMARKQSGAGGLSPTGNRYWNLRGNGALYDWDALDVRWVMTFRGADDTALGAVKSDRAEDDNLPRPSAPKP